MGASTDPRRRTWRGPGPTRRRCRRGRSSSRTARRGCRARRPRRGSAPVLEQPDRHHVDQRVALVRRVEDELAADRRDADAVAVAADARARRRRRGAASVRRTDRRSAARRGPRSAARPSRRCRAGSRRRRSPRPDTARPRDGWLWLLDLERDREPVADRDHARVLARPRDDARRRRSAASPAAACELLYEQCSLHMTLNIASSRSFGSRPSRSRIASSSSSVEPERAVQRRRPTVTVTRGATRERRAPRRRRSAPSRRARPALSTSERMMPQAVVGAEDRLDARSGWGISPATLPAR